MRFRFIALGIMGALLLSAVEPDKGLSRRFCLVIGANYGGPAREKLRYAVSDARAMLQVMETIGGILLDDSRLLVEPDRETLFWEIERLKERMLRARSENLRVEVIVYYSGHSDDTGILLGREKISYADFRSALEKLPTDVRIAILDSCASGAFIRFKGGRRLPSFLLDTAYDMKGFAVMTSSSASEVSQESDRIRGSFFTHHLIAGLRGAADLSLDGRVTLSEAYQYAFRETLNQTEKTASGPQHPSYTIQMSGTGDVVITDIRRSTAILRLRSDVAGKIFIHTPANTLVMELRKGAGTNLDLGLDQGKYRVIAIDGEGIHEATVELAEGETRELPWGQFREIEIIDTTARGDRLAWKTTGEPQRKPLSFFIGFFAKMARYEGRWSLMPGMLFGMDFHRTVSLGLIGFGKTAPEANSRPPFWGVDLDYVFLSSGRLNVSLGSIVGFMYKDRQDEIAKKLSLVLEPGCSMTWSLSPQLKLWTRLSLDFVNGTNDSLRRFSLGMGLILGKK